MYYLDIVDKLLYVAEVLCPFCLWIYLKKSKFRSFLALFWYRVKYSNCRFFYDEDLSKKIITTQSKMQKSHFIDYSIAKRNQYYALDQTTISVRVNGNTEELNLPYSILADYIEDNKMRISVENIITDQYELPTEIDTLTTPVLEDFLNNKPGTYNESILRINSLCPNQNGIGWRCILQQTDYFTQIRTNLTLDVQLDNDLGKEDTLRQRDMMQAEYHRLPKFENSVMANSIGVSAIWCFVSKVSKRTSKRRFFFLKPRRQNTGVFSNMLGSVSGAVKFPQNGNINEPYLENYLINEMRREFYEETGYDEFMKDNSITEDKITIIPLAFAREFARGGKPQFFFLIVTPEISNRDMIKYYKKSLDGFNEFDDTLLKNSIQNIDLSPETHTNFIYALKYIQKNRNCPFVDLD